MKYSVWRVVKGVFERMIGAVDVCDDDILSSLSKLGSCVPLIVFVPVRTAVKS
jgi:hypothetical protein